MTAMALLAVCFGAGLVRLAYLAVPPRADLKVAVGRWEMARDRTHHHGPATTSGPDRSLTQRAAARLANALTRRGVNLTQVSQDLAIAGKTLEQHLSRVLVLVFVGLLAPGALGAVALAVGLPIPVQVPVFAGLLLGVVMALVSHHELHKDAENRREELRHTLSIYLDLVAMSMEAGRGHPEALPAAAAIGTGWSFEALQDAISGARYAGTTPWAALGILGDRFGVHEMQELSASLNLAADEGSKIKASLTARATTLRAKRLADAQGEANEASESMRFALIVMVFAFFTYQLYPPIANLFGG